ncbi:DNA cytosine methyltransferase [Aminobacter sp. J41]|uniref:DNA cytosine methyltransferase n=1 Tax=Aminobacter sp. J41 TaxID=935261 RepID=UPI000687EC81|nr:DNA cytosine methyltransferase [Aminobacter sp. J41]
MRAIDLYAGVGGWSLGLNLADISVVASYERWRPAIATNRRNNQHDVVEADIRTMPLDALPRDIDLVVGSPPCTQFSYANRGGSGDIEDGLKDIARFLEIVEYLRPKWWVMENVPRVVSIVEKELKEGGCLERFRHLEPRSEVFRLEEFGIPQRRRRCLIGNINFDLLHSYTRQQPSLALGEVLRALGGETVVDPLYGFSRHRSQVSDHELERPLSEEELRINRSSKELHPVYNRMPFPEPLDKPVRTITAVCTRVSRESIIVDGGAGFRRLSVRERASLQGFPIDYEFEGVNYAQKARLVGNAIPPVFTYLVGQAAKGVLSTKVMPLRKAYHPRQIAQSRPMSTKPIETVARRFPPTRTFRFAIPALHFKSGVRFELHNRAEQSTIQWAVDLWFGPSKSISRLRPDRHLAGRLGGAFLRAGLCLSHRVMELERFLASVDFVRLQDVWAHQGPGGTRPFDLLDGLDYAASKLATDLNPYEELSCRLVASEVDYAFAETGSPRGAAKLLKNATKVAAGMLVSGVFNGHIADQVKTSPLAPFLRSDGPPSDYAAHRIGA